MTYATNTNFTSFSSHFLFFLRNPDHVKNQILLRFRVTFLFFLFETLMTREKQILLHRKHKFYISMARICSKIYVYA